MVSLGDHRDVYHEAERLETSRVPGFPELIAISKVSELQPPLVPRRRRPLVDFRETAFGRFCIDLLLHGREGWIERHPSSSGYAARKASSFTLRETLVSLLSAFFSSSRVFSRRLTMFSRPSNCA